MCPCTEVCTLGQLQRKVKYAKVVKGGNIQVQNMLEMGQLIQPLLMPPQVCDLVPAAAGALGVPVRDILYIPMDAASFDVHGACFTGPMQIQWIGQLCGLDYCFVLHIDGKHKLHHGKWLLITLGTHSLNWNKHHNALGNTFNPLIYMFCKEHETLGSGQLICASLNKVALQYFGKKLVPGAGCTDHCQSFRRALVEEWPTIQFGQCYPHIARKFGEGAYCNKTWKHMGEVQLDIRAINLAGTKDMKALLLGVIGADWDVKGKTMDKFWYSNCVEPWDCWSICDFECMLATPSNQTQESWHKQLILKKIPGMFKASTAFVINTTLPLLAKIDGLSMSSKLQFEVETLPRDMVIKAMWYVDHKSTHFSTAKDRNGDIFYYFLAKANPGGFKKIGKINLAAYVDACQGIRHASCHTKERLIHFCQSFHFLYAFNDDTYSLPVCHWNPGNFTCPTCKGFKHVGICSHVLATNHILELIDLDYLMGALCKPRKKGGQTQKPRPALQREADSSECSTPPESDDELPRID